MSELKTAILDAKYIDMIELADFVVRDCGLPDMDDNGEMLPQQNEIAAAIFRWAAGAELGAARPQRAAANGAAGTTQPASPMGEAQDRSGGPGAAPQTTPEDN